MLKRYYYYWSFNKQTLKKKKKSSNKEVYWFYSKGISQTFWITWASLLCPLHLLHHSLASQRTHLMNTHKSTGFQSHEDNILFSFSRRFSLLLFLYLFLFFFPFFLFLLLIFINSMEDPWQYARYVWFLQSGLEWWFNKMVGKSGGWWTKQNSARGDREANWIAQLE